MGLRQTSTGNGEMSDRVIEDKEIEIHLDYTLSLVEFLDEQMNKE